MVALATMAEFKETHRRAIAVTAEYMDDLLSDAAINLGLPVNGRLAHRYSADANPRQQEVVHAFVMNFQGVIRDFLDSHDVSLEGPPRSGLENFRRGLQFVLVQLDGITPKSLKGYGELDRKFTCDLEEFIAAFRRLIEGLERDLRECGDQI